MFSILETFISIAMFSVFVFVGGIYLLAQLNAVLNS